MNNVDEKQTGMTSGRNWGAFPAHENAMEWSVDPEGGLVQGPLDLEFLRGKRVHLALEPGQMALLVGENQLQAVYLDGGHQLDIGQGAKQIPTSSSLIFLASSRPIQLRWTKLDPVTWNNQHGLETIGHCSLFIDAPTRFYRSFLEKTTCWDEQSIHQEIDAAARNALKTILEASFPGGQASEAEIQSRLTNLNPEEVAEGLAEHGLACSQVAVYTAVPPVENNPAERTGQFSGLVHN